MLARRVGGDGKVAGSVQGWRVSTGGFLLKRTEVRAQNFLSPDRLPAIVGLPRTILTGNPGTTIVKTDTFGGGQRFQELQRCQGYHRIKADNPDDGFLQGYRNRRLLPRNCATLHKIRRNAALA